MVKRLVWLSLAAVLCVSCQKFAEGRQVFHNLLILRDQIAAEFHEKVVDVSVIKGDRIVVKFINSPYNTRTRDEKQQRTHDVADFVTKHYKNPVSAVSVTFASPSSAETYVVKTPAP